MKSFEVPSSKCTRTVIGRLDGRPSRVAATSASLKATRGSVTVASTPIGFGSSTLKVPLPEAIGAPPASSKDAVRSVRPPPIAVTTPPASTLPISASPVE